MATENKTDYLIKVLPSIITLITVIVGVWQFNKGQEEIKRRDIEQRKNEVEKVNRQAYIETMTKFREIRNKLYADATTTVSYLTVHTDVNSATYKENLDKFWRLYWVELSSVETPEVEGAMKRFGDIITDLQEHNSANISERLPGLKVAGYNVAQAIKKSAGSWALPEAIATK